MKKEIEELSVSDWEIEEFDRNAPENSSKFVIYALHETLKIFWKQMLYTDEEINIAANIFYEMEHSGEVGKISSKFWKKEFGDTRKEIALEKNPDKFGNFVEYLCERIQKETHERTLKYLMKMSH